MRLCDAPTMRELDRVTIETYGIPGVVLMENAGRGATALLLQHFPLEARQGISIFCGKGNNGGDGLVMARHLHNAGFAVQTYLLAPRSRYQGDARVNLLAADAMGLPVTEVLTEETWAEVKADACRAGVLVDALFGTGLSSEVRGLSRAVIEAMNASGRAVLAVDIPSGLDALSGRPLGVAVKASLTATFGLVKRGLCLEPALPYVGRLEVVEISIPAALLAEGPGHDRLLEASTVAGLLPKRPAGGHKGTFGHVLVVGGSLGKVGAAVLACHAALRSGVGLVTLALPVGALSLLSGLWPEIMLEALPDGGKGHLTLDSLPRLKALAQQRDAVALGPGISTELEVKACVRAFLSELERPAVIDADGLNALVGDLSPELLGPGSRVLTPHPGEASRLLSCPIATLQADRVGATQNLASRAGAVCLLKGARTLVATASGRISVNPTGNHGLATAGSGDVLTGVVGGLLAQGLTADDAACAGAFLHGLAGDLVRSRWGARALKAGDVVEALGEAFLQVLGEGA